MSLADAIRIKNLEADFATLTRRLDVAHRQLGIHDTMHEAACKNHDGMLARLDALEKYVTELPPQTVDHLTDEWEHVAPKRGPGRPKKDAIMKSRAKIGDAHFE